MNDNKQIILQLTKRRRKNNNENDAMKQKGRVRKIKECNKKERHDVIEKRPS